MGEGNGWFDAFNASTGDRVWRYNLGAGVNAPPITYQVNGEQYIAVAAGGNFQMTYPMATHLPSLNSPLRHDARGCHNRRCSSARDRGSGGSGDAARSASSDLVGSLAALGLLEQIWNDGRFF
jgi:outer membrane protein assembly factor BamB